MQSSKPCFFLACYVQAKSLSFVLECCDAAYINRSAFYGRTACTNVGCFSRSWDVSVRVRFDQKGTGRQDFGCVSNNESLGTSQKNVSDSNSLRCLPLRLRPLRLRSAPTGSRSESVSVSPRAQVCGSKFLVRRPRTLPGLFRDATATSSDTTQFARES